MGPAAILDIEEFRPFHFGFRLPDGIVVDDSTGREGSAGYMAGLPLREEVKAAFAQAQLDAVAPNRNNPHGGDGGKPGTAAPYASQQQYFADAVTKVILPMFEQSGKPFLVVFWSRDPDATQHNEVDSLNKLTPGINGQTSREALKIADASLEQILDCIHSDPKLRANTDIFATSDHGFATISRHEIDRMMRPTQSYSATFKYFSGSDGALEIPEGYLPTGFLAIDLAHALGMKLYDPDRVTSARSSDLAFPEVDPASSPTTATKARRPVRGNGLIGNNILRAEVRYRSPILSSGKGKVCTAGSGVTAPLITWLRSGPISRLTT